ncbi:MAG: histidine phosphatase family protein [Acidimicrobiia bacterium]|nr:histidine phosphatase family protein [Acidimicrobiia bacterium]
MRRLLVMRHGKSDWSTGMSDHDRPLNRRGIEAAKTMGRLLTEVGEAPDHVITSGATRAQTTAELARESGDWTAEMEVTDDLYGTGIDTVLSVVAGAPDVERLMIVGHEPVWSGLVAHLTGGAVAMKTATVAGIDLLVRDWEEAPLARSEMVFVLQPRHFAPVDP